MTALCDAQLQCKGSSILNDCSHLLHGEFQLLHSASKCVVPKVRKKDTEVAYIFGKIVFLLYNFCLS